MTSTWDTADRVRLQPRYASSTLINPPRAGCGACTWRHLMITSFVLFSLFCIADRMKSSSVFEHDVIAHQHMALIRSQTCSFSSNCELNLFYIILRMAQAFWHQHFCNKVTIKPRRRQSRLAPSPRYRQLSLTWPRGCTSRSKDR